MTAAAPNSKEQYAAHLPALQAWPQWLQVDATRLSLRVAPGDIVHGDENGVVVFPAAHVADVIRLAHEILAFEADIFGYFRAADFSLAGLKKRLGA